MIARPWVPAIRTLLFLALVSAGGVLVAHGSSEYWGAKSIQEEAAKRWPHSVIPRSPDSPLKDAEPFSQLEVPRLSQTFYVVEGSDEQALSKGPGHVKGTAMPGEEGNCVIAGHRNLQFRFLKDLHRGDLIFLATTEGRFCYRVTGTRIIPPTDLTALQPTRDAELHLITCFPFFYVGHAPKRYVVSAVLD